MKVSVENDNNFGYEKNTILVDNMPLTHAHTIEVPVPITQSERSRINVKGGDFSSFYDFSIRFWNCSDSVVYFILHFEYWLAKSLPLSRHPLLLCSTF
jgi:hypothetical protein